MEKFNKNKVLLHVILWVCYMYFPILLNLLPSDATLQLFTDEGKITIQLYIILFINFFSILIFYLNSEILIPKVLKTRGMILYAVIVVAIFYALGNLNYMLKSALFEQFKYKYFSPSTLMLLISVFAISIGYRFFMDYNNAQINQRELESERMKSELSFLRSQISPHFMFNLLNSLVSLARKKSDMVEPVLIKMSELLRYMLYESDDSLVTLDKELKYLQSYIDLQKLRFGGYVQINFESYNVTSSKTIEPMLLIPFIENSFKHGVSLVKSPTIDILMQIEENKLIFEVENKFNSDFVETKDGNSGIGLHNVRRRLELLYPNNHELIISQENGLYSVRLELTLKTSFKPNPRNIQSRVLESTVYQ